MQDTQRHQAGSESRPRPEICTWEPPANGRTWRPGGGGSALEGGAHRRGARAPDSPRRRSSECRLGRGPVRGLRGLRREDGKVGGKLQGSDTTEPEQA